MAGRAVRVASGTASAGQLTHRFTIFAPAGTANVADTNVAEHVPMRVSSVELSQQLEYLTAGGVQAASTYVVTCRYRTDIRMDAVLVEECHTQRRMQILSQLPTDDMRWLNMVCTVAV
jgi:head-tail adaptor